jgi:hypothetical protein
VKNNGYIIIENVLLILGVFVLPIIISMLYEKSLKKEQLRNLELVKQKVKSKVQKKGEIC